MSPEQLLFEVEDVLKTMPTNEAFDTGELSSLEWLGRCKSVVSAWDSVHSLALSGFEQQLTSTDRRSDSRPAYRRLLALLHQAKSDLRMKTQGPLTIAVDAGKPFQYFEEIRQILSQAKSEVFFVDPYLDSEFVARYLPQVGNGVSVRLLTNIKMIAKLVPAVQMFAQQHAVAISLRSAAFHDRHLFIDKAECYQSGGSFNAGGMKSAVTLTQVTDAFDQVTAIYEAKWADAQVHV
ncbi:MAG: hypothetical protein H7Y28_15135 [Rhodoferax sp.]|nr:hypothetical protein [Rhodoferax sp.]